MHMYFILLIILLLFYIINSYHTSQCNCRYKSQCNCRCKNCGGKLERFCRKGTSGQTICN